MKRSCLLVFLSLFLSISSYAYYVKDSNIDELYSLADVVFQGTCVKVEKGVLDGNKNLPTVKYTFNIENVIKGNIKVNDEFLFSMADKVDTSSSGGFHSPLAANPRFEKDKSYILFLAGESKLGLRAPIGLESGKFDIVVEDGKKFVKNRFSNKSIFQNSSSKATKSIVQSSDGPIPLDDFLKVMEGLKK